MNIIKNFFILLTLTTYSFLGCMGYEVELLRSMEEGQYGTFSDEKSRLIENISRIIDEYTQKFNGTQKENNDLKKILENIEYSLNDRSNIEKLPLDSIKEINGLLSTISGSDINIDNLKEVSEILNFKQKNRLKKLIYKNKQAIGCISSLFFIMIIISIYFGYCSYHGEHGICYESEPNTNSTNFDPCAYDPCDTGAEILP